MSISLTYVLLSVYSSYCFNFVLVVFSLSKRWRKSLISDEETKNAREFREFPARDGKSLDKELSNC